MNIIDLATQGAIEMNKQPAACAQAEQSTEHNPTFEELEVAILDDFRSTGHLLPEPVISHASDPIHIGNMVIDLILLAKNMNLDLVSCLIAARNKGIKK